MSDTDPLPILHGVRVVDMTQYLAGPTVTRLMAELGYDEARVAALVDAGVLHRGDT